MLSLSLSDTFGGSITDAFTSHVLMVFGLALTLVTFVLVIVVARFNRTSLSLLFSKVSKD